MASLASRYSMTSTGGAGEQLGVAGFLDADLPHHLAHDDLDVLVVDVNALLTVGLLDFLDEVVVDGVDAADAQDVVGSTVRLRSAGRPC